MSVSMTGLNATLDTLHSHYSVSLFSPNSDIPSSYDIFYVSDIAVVHQKLPDGKIRLGIVSATTGHPLSGAEIQLYSNKGKISGSPLTCDDDGEVVFQKDRDVNSFFAYTENDRYCPKASDRKSTRLNSSHLKLSRMPSSA